MKKHFYTFFTIKFFKRYVFIFFTLGMFCLSFYLMYKDVKKNTIQEFNKEQLILAKTASQGISSFWDNYQSSLSYIVKQNDIIHFTENGKTSMKYFYDNHKSVIKAITKVDNKGIIEHTYPINKAAIGKDISNQEHVKETLATKKPVISDVFMSVQGYYAIAMHVPIFDKTKYMGSLAILIPIDKMGELFLDNIKSNKKGLAWLITENYTEVYCTHKEHQGKSIFETTNNDKHTLKLLDKIKNYKSGTGKITHQNTLRLNDNSEEMYVVYYHVLHGNTFWTILISYQESEVYLALSNFRSRLIKILILLFIAISYYFYSLVKARNVLREESKRKKAEKLLRESNERFHSFMENTPIYAYIKDSAHNYIYQNKNIDTVTAQKELKELFDEATTKKLKEADLKILSGKQENVEFNFSVVLYGKTKWLKNLKFKIKTANNKNAVGGVVLDITELKNYEKELEENKLNLESLVNKRTKALKNANIKLEKLYEELKNQKEEVEITLTTLKETQSRLVASEKMASLGVLTAGVSHEINNPLQYLTGIHYGLVDYFEKYGSKDKHTTDLLLTSTETAITRISSIVKGLNQFSNDTNVIDNNCNIHSIINNCLAVLSNQTSSKIIFNKQYDSQELLIKGKSNKLHQVFINILLNAIQSILNTGTITIKTHKNKEAVFIEIIDTGCGIMKQDLPKIIEPFFTTKDPGKGIGLGLSIAYTIIQDHKGYIDFESEINQGTKIKITLPIKAKN
ncbi:PAS domain S-box-containing protein [Wenyingzhuangia heitensis]|uniref:histidine kinase n=1 Tax=Wenyingzhuangia heitensis TaxID=1487859 RepID=A0ABX0UBD0_9FLAO|nr:ATP-binding protein [Wenyingzhuangia heitensis]NIJ45603.1 PAS domain S-box-containing protein [Wenyingzhuangia heitensis]